MTLTAVAGVEVGHWTDPVGRTGVTVVVLPEPNVAAHEVRGGAPGSREITLLEPGMRVEAVQAIVLSGGSAFGLATADGVVRELELQGRGHPAPLGPVPIVPTAVVYDLAVGDPRARPGPEEGAMALRAASGRPVEMGAVGAGAGATCANWRGMEARRPGGIGSTSVEVEGGIVGALVVVNAAGDVFTLAGEPLTGGSPEPPFAPTLAWPEEGNTTLVVVATDVAASRSDLRRVAVRAQDAVAACIRPSHTRYDGDLAFAVSCGAGRGDTDQVGEAAFVAVGRAIEAAVRQASGEGW